MHIEDQQLIAFLVDAGIAEQTKLERAHEKAKKDGKKLGDLLVAEGIVTE